MWRHTEDCRNSLSCCLIFVTSKQRKNRIFYMNKACRSFSSGFERTNSWEQLIKQATVLDHFKGSEAYLGRLLACVSFPSIHSSLFPRSSPDACISTVLKVIFFRAHQSHPRWAKWSEGAVQVLKCDTPENWKSDSPLTFWEVKDCVQ